MNDCDFRKDLEDELKNIEWTLSVIYRNEVFTDDEIKWLCDEAERLKTILEVLQRLFVLGFLPAGQRRRPACFWVVVILRFVCLM